jgi:hypothetical protein
MEKSLALAGNRTPDHPVRSPVAILSSPGSPGCPSRVQVWVHCCWPSPVQSILVPGPTRLTTIFFCLTAPSASGVTWQQFVRDKDVLGKRCKEKWNIPFISNELLPKVLRFSIQLNKNWRKSHNCYAMSTCTSELVYSLINSGLRNTCGDCRSSLFIYTSQDFIPDVFVARKVEGHV